MHELFPEIWMTNLMYSINLFITLIALICMWYILKKMGQPGWKAIVPLYSVWVLVKTLKKPRGWFWAYLLPIITMLGSGFLFLILVMTAAQTGIEPSKAALISSGIVMFLSMTVGVVFEIRIMHALSKSFTRSGWFTLGMILLPIIFLPILAFGEDEFTAPEVRKEPSAPAAEPGTAEEKTTEPASETTITEPEISEESAEGSE